MKLEQNVKQITNEKSQITSLVTGVAVAYAITCIVLIAYSILLRYSKVSFGSSMLVITITCIVSVIVAGYDAAHGASNKGWLWGILAGLLYAVILVAIGFFVDDNFSFDTSSIMLLILAVAGGGLGGVIGINIKK